MVVGIGVSSLRLRGILNCRRKRAGKPWENRTGKAKGRAK